MRRRTFVAATAGSFGGVAGCVSNPQSSGFANGNNENPKNGPCTVETPSDSEVPVTTNTESFAAIYPPEEPAIEIVVGDDQTAREQIPEARIENETSDRIRATATLLKGENSSGEVMRSECNLEAREYIAIAPREPDVYELQVKSETGDNKVSLDIDPAMFEEESFTYHVNLHENDLETLCGGGAGGG